MIRSLFSVCLVLIVSGCGDDGHLPLFPATGSVMVDGRPVEGIEVRLHPQDRLDDLDALRPFATTDAQGRFVLGTYVKEDGAPAGPYRVTLFWPDRPPGPSPPEDRLGGAYSQARETPFEATIAEGSNEIPAFQAVPKAPATPEPRARSDRPDFDAVIAPPAS